MPYQLTVVERVVVVQWQTMCAPSDPGRLSADLTRVHAAVRRPLALVIVVPRGFPLPDAAARKANAEHGPRGLALCDALQGVVEGEGVLPSLLRAVMTGLVMVMRLPFRGTLHATLDQALAALPPDTLLLLPRLRTQLASARIAA